MKILHINSNYLHSELHKNQVEYLNKKAIDNTVVVPRKFKEKNNMVENIFNGDEIIYEKKILDFFDRVFYYRKQQKIKSMLNDFNISLKNYDIIHAHTLFTDGYIAYKSGQKYVVTIRNTDVNYFMKYMKHLLIIGRKIIMNANALVFLSNVYLERTIVALKLTKEQEKIVRRKSYVIPNGIEKIWIDNKKNKSKSINNIPQIIFVGKINKNKNLRQVTNSLKNLPFKVKLHVVGDVQNDRYFRKAYDEFNFTYHGKLEKKEIIKIYESCDIFILTSHYESFGLVYLEALTQNLPIIYTKNEGIYGYFKEGEVGFSVNPNNSKDLGLKIKEIIENYDKIQNNIVLLDKWTFGWEENVNRIINVYKQIK